MPDQDYRALARVGRELVFNETLYLLFLKDGRSDPSRTNQAVQGTLRVGNEKQSNATGGGAQAWSARMSTGEAMAYISRGSYDGPPIRVGDKIRENNGTLDAPQYVLYEVSGFNDRDPQDLILTLSEA